MTLQTQPDGAQWEDGDGRKCRLCGGGVEMVAPMAALPPTDRFTREPNDFKLTPADLYGCATCGHVQLTDVIPPAVLFEDYLFRTGDNPDLVEHFREYADDCIRRFDCSFVVEIGSNDGTLLDFFVKYRRSVVLGIDPSSVESKFETLAGYFDENMGRVLRESRGQANLILANHVFAHADDLTDMLRGIKALLAPTGVFVFEAMYLHDLIEKKYYDTVFHEHLSYHSIEALMPFFAKHGLELFDVRHNDCKGGSIRGFVQHAGTGREKSKWWLMNFGDNLERVTKRSFGAFNKGLAQIIGRAAALDGCIGYGASASGIAMMYHAQLDSRTKILVDDDPRKHGLFSPHANIPVASSDVLYHSDSPIVILAPRYDAAIRARHPTLADRFVSLL